MFVINSIQGAVESALAGEADGTNQLNANQVESVIETLFNYFSKCINIIGPIMAFALLTFIFTVSYAFFNIAVPYWSSQQGPLFGTVIFLLAIYLILNLLVNYILSVFIKPGSIEDLLQSKYYLTNNPYSIKSGIVDLNDVFYNEENKKKPKELKEIKYDKIVDESLVVNNFENMNNNDQNLQQEETNKINQEQDLNNNDLNNNENKFELKMCKYCNIPKILRSHHCSACGYCVFKMDHHCPWINNCVGQNNHKYFMRFLAFLTFFCIFNSFLSVPILYYTKTELGVFRFSTILSLAGIVLSFFFNAWNWVLVLKGATTIEFFTILSGVKSNHPIQNYSLSTWRDNVFMVFGTRSLLKAIFAVNFRKLPYSGLEWTRLVFADFRHELLNFGEELDC